MKKLATITGENGEEIAISYNNDNGQLFTECVGRVDEVGPSFTSEDDAAEYIQASWSTWGLVWASA